MEVAITKQDSAVQNLDPPATERQLVVVGSSLLFSILQSVCTAVVAINGVRFVLGLGSLAMTVGVGAALDHLHEITWLRITLMLGALFGSLVTLFIVFHARGLRNKSSARWRLQPLTPRQRRMEALQIVMSVLTLILVTVEEYFHFRLIHTL
ncbi:MAG: hypothetical protein ABSA39_18065 [Edaphobacter sp.]